MTSSFTGIEFGRLIESKIVVVVRGSPAQKRLQICTCHKYVPRHSKQLRLSRNVRSLAYCLIDA